MKIKKIKDIISDENYSDEYVIKVFENTPYDQFNKEERDELLSLFKDKRPQAYSDLLFEVASKYM